VLHFEKVEEIYLPLLEERPEVGDWVARELRATN
jgi:hypothetical protein